MDPKMKSSSSSSKITDVVRLQRILKKWKKLAVSPKPTSTTTSTTPSKTINSFLKRTLSFSSDGHSSEPVPKGYLAVCVSKELKRFVIPMAHLSRRAFRVLLQEAEEEFGFQQEGVLKIPCEVALFENVLKAVEDKKASSSSDEFDVFPDERHYGFGYSVNGVDEDQWEWCRSPSSCDRHAQLCR